MNLEKLGFHCNQTPAGLLEYMAQVQPPLIVVLDHSLPIWQEIRDACPDTIIAGRVIPDEGQDWNSSLLDPLHEALKAFRRLDPFMERMDGIIDVWLPWNEPVIKTKDAMLAFNDATCYLMEKAAPVKIGAGGFASGNPPIGLWRYFLEALTMALQTQSYGFVHEYDWPNMLSTYPWTTGRLQQCINGNAATHVQPEDVWGGLPEPLKSNLRWLITETGLDHGHGPERRAGVVDARACRRLRD